MTLDLFVCWADSDPFYQEYFPDCNVLISLPNVALSWTVERFSTEPGKIMVDSGAFAYLSKPNKRMSQKDVFTHQLHLSQNSKATTILCHLDHPIPPALTDTVEIYRRIEATIANAHEFMNLFKSANLPSNFKTMGIIQGNSYDSIAFCATELDRLGFDFLGMGSLATLYNNDLILERVEYAISTIGKQLHIFGISGIKVVMRLMELGIRSFDSSRPMKAAIYNCVFYSNPFRRFKLKGSSANRELPVLAEPLPCPCPVCKKDPTLIIKVGTKKATNYRAVHNFYHLRSALEGLATELDSAQDCPSTR